jgi:phage gp29-like protein
MASFDEDLRDIMNNIGESRKVSDMLSEILQSLRNVDACLSDMEAKEAVTQGPHLPTSEIKKNSPLDLPSHLH